MFGSKRQHTVLAEGLKIVGHMTSDGTVEINGELDGEIHCSSLIVTRGGKVTAKVTAESAVVDGFVEGPIEASDVMLKARAHVVGDIVCEALAIEKGAFIEGRLVRPLAPNAGDRARRPALERDRGVTPAVEAAEADNAKHASKDPDLLIEDALALMASRGNRQAKSSVASAQKKNAKDT